MGVALVTVAIPVAGIAFVTVVPQMGVLRKEW